MSLLAIYMLHLPRIRSAAAQKDRPKTMGTCSSDGNSSPLSAGETKSSARDVFRFSDIVGGKTTHVLPPSLPLSYYPLFILPGGQGTHAANLERLAVCSRATWVKTELAVVYNIAVRYGYTSTCWRGNQRNSRCRRQLYTSAR